MKPCLADVNVWLALLARHHQHHQIALDWYGSVRPVETGMPRIVQLGVVRLLTNRSIHGPHTLATGPAWRMVQELLEDERVDILAEPNGLDRIFSAYLDYRVAAPKLLNDAYLAAFAVSSGRRLVTLDRGFTQFNGLDLEVLG